MKNNVGTVDRLIRIVLAIVFIVMGFAWSPWWFLLAAIALVTALVGWCGLYSIFGWSTHTEKVPVKKSKTVKAAKKTKKK